MIRKYSQHVLREDIDIQYGLLIRSRIVALIRLQAHAQNVQKYYAAQKKNPDKIGLHSFRAARVYNVNRAPVAATMG